MDAQPSEIFNLADLTPLLDEHGHVIDWLDEPAARARIRSGELTVCRTKRKIRALRMRTAPALAASPPRPDLSKWTVFRHPARPGESHKEKCAANPYGVWVIEPIRKRDTGFFGLRAPVGPARMGDRDDGQRAA